MRGMWQREEGLSEVVGPRGARNKIPLSTVELDVKALKGYAFGVSLRLSRFKGARVTKIKRVYRKVAMLEGKPDLMVGWSEVLVNRALCKGDLCQILSYTPPRKCTTRVEVGPRGILKLSSIRGVSEQLEQRALQKLEMNIHTFEGMSCCSAEMSASYTVQMLAGAMELRNLQVTRIFEGAVVYNIGDDTIFVCVADAVRYLMAAGRQLGMLNGSQSHNGAADLFHVDFVQHHFWFRDGDWDVVIPHMPLRGFGERVGQMGLSELGFQAGGVVGVLPARSGEAFKIQNRRR